MKKTTKIIIAIVIVIIAVLALFLLFGNKTESNIKINSAEELTSLIDDIYAGVEIEMPMLMTQPIDIADKDAVKAFTGLDNADDIEYVVASEPMMTSQAYSLVLVKVKSGANASKIADTMNKNVDARKWICVTAEKVYSTSSGDVVCLVMSNEETAKAVYNSFKKIAGSVGQEYERAGE